MVYVQNLYCNSVLWAFARSGHVAAANSAVCHRSPLAVRRLFIEVQCVLSIANVPVKETT
eukprot:6466224-Amphidinium_carterae.1